MRHIFQNRTIVIGVFVIALIGAAIININAMVTDTAPTQPQAKRVIIKLKEAATVLQDGSVQMPPSIEALNKKYNVQNISDLLKKKMPGKDYSLMNNVYILVLDAGTDISAAVREYSQDPHVVYAQPDYVAQTQ